MRNMVQNIGPGTPSIYVTITAKMCSPQQILTEQKSDDPNKALRSV